MKSQSIYFLQALWDVDADRNKLLTIAKEAMLSDIKRSLGGMMDPMTIWNSEAAKNLKGNVINLQERVQAIQKPADLIGINKEFVKTAGTLRALQIKTAQSLHSDGGVKVDELHVIVKQLIPYALTQVKKQTAYQMYRLMVLGAKIPEKDFYYPRGNFFHEWLYFYKNKLKPLFSLMDDDMLDSRWAYERRLLEIDQDFYVEQFIRVKPLDKEFHQPLGIPGVGTGRKGEFRIFGRGNITNLTPADFEKEEDFRYGRKIPECKDYSIISNENLNPVQIMNQLYRNKKYLISPDTYFEFINKCILAKTFHQRLKVGNCFCCGSPLYKGVCSHCGRKGLF